MQVLDDKELRRDLKRLARFIDLYCGQRHAEAPKSPVVMKSYDLKEIAGKPIELCDSCAKLLQHAYVKRSVCPFEPKPACKHCRDHCYHPAYRRQIKEVMQFSGRKLLLSGRLDYLFHMLF